MAYYTHTQEIHNFNRKNKKYKYMKYYKDQLHVHSSFSFLFFFIYPTIIAKKERGKLYNFLVFSFLARFSSPNWMDGYLTLFRMLNGIFSPCASIVYSFLFIIIPKKLKYRNIWNCLQWKWGYCFECVEGKQIYMEHVFPMEFCLENNIMLEHGIVALTVGRKEIKF